MSRQIQTAAFNVMKTNVLLKNSNFLHQRAYTPESLLNYEPNSPEQLCLEQSLKELKKNPVEVPIAIGDVNHHSGDFHLQRMPHNWRCSVARMSWANRQIVNLAIRMAKDVELDWCTTPMEERVEIWRSCADILATENRHDLNAAIMLGQGKTLRQAEEDTCRTINNIRHFAELALRSEQEDDENCEHRMRSTGGFIAAMTPYNWTSAAVDLALCPALMGNCVLWMPSPFNVLSCYIVYKALEKADIPPGVINFIPSNPNFFVENITKSRDLAGINYAGRLFSYQNVARAVSEQLERHNSFASALGPKDGKNFHFVHQSADVSTVAAATALAAFDYSGQRGSSCEILFVPRSMWCDMKVALAEQMDELKPDDVSKFDTKMSAVINKVSYNRIVGMLQHAEKSDTCEIVHGGNYQASHGYFVEPTLIECNTLDTKIMRKQIEGPVLGVYVYEDDKFEEFACELAQKHQYTLSASIFANDDRAAEQIGGILNCTAANLYFNRPCIGSIDGQSIEQPCMALLNNADPKCQLHHWLPPDCC